MKFSMQIIIFTTLTLFFAGCNTPGSTQTPRAAWEGTKIFDIAPSPQKAEKHLLRTIDFDIYTFQIPAENLSKLENAWQILNTDALGFKDYKTFKSNSFAAGFGQTTTWDKIGEILLDANASGRSSV